MILKSRANHYRNAILDVDLLTYEKDGKDVQRFVVSRSGAAVILAAREGSYNGISRLLLGLVKQFRATVGEDIWELPAGVREEGELSLVTARRECEEELGWYPKSVVFVRSFYSSPGFVDEPMDLYLCTDLVRTDQNLDHDESLEVAWLPYETVRAMVLDGTIIDAKTIIGVLLFEEVWRKLWETR